MSEVEEVMAKFGEELGLTGSGFDENGHCNLGIDEKFDVQLSLDEEAETIAAFNIQIQPGIR